MAGAAATSTPTDSAVSTSTARSDRASVPVTSSPAPVRAARAGKALVATGTASTAYGRR